VKCGGSDCRFALEYERIAKTKSRYMQIGIELDNEVHIDTLLYLAPTYHVLSCMKQCFAPRRLVICLAIAAEFAQDLLAARVVVAGESHRTVAFEDVLTRSAGAGRKSKSLSTHLA
jgi:hypothetical protein